MKHQIGTRVRMSKNMKMDWDRSSPDHIKEFGECIGTIIGYMFDDTKEWVDVRWEPSKLRYGYLHEELEKV